MRYEKLEPKYENHIKSSQKILEFWVSAYWITAGDCIVKCEGSTQ